MTKNPTVRIFSGLGIQSECRWKGQLQHIPRVSEEIVLTDGNTYYVQRVSHVLNDEPSEVWIYVR